MLSIYAGDALVASMGSNDQTRAVTSPSLAMEVGKAGSLKFSIYPTHPLYESMQKLVTIVTVRDGEDILFRGRVYSIERKITGERQVYPQSA